MVNERVVSNECDACADGKTHAAGDHGEADPGQMGPHIGRIPFIGGRGIAVEQMAAEELLAKRGW